MNDPAADPTDANGVEPIEVGSFAAIGDEPDHQPDPVTLSEPSYDDEGRLRWASLSLPGGVGPAR